MMIHFCCAGLLLLPVFIVTCKSNPSAMNRKEVINQAGYTVKQRSWYNTRHHKKDGGFQNIWGPYERPSGIQAAGWITSRMWQFESYRQTASRKILPEEIGGGTGKMRIFWLGHSTILIQSSGKNILTDPIFNFRASPVSFAGPARIGDVPLTIDELPKIHYIIMSHNHYDHMSKESLEKLVELHDPVILVPAALKERFNEWGMTKVIEMDWWQYTEADGHRFECTPSQHFSSRSLWDENETLWCAWAVHDLKKDTLLYFAGDTGYGPFFKEFREKIRKPDVALIPIGAYMPRWFMKIVHVDPEEALQAFEDLEADYMLPIHWGTYDLADEKLHEPAETFNKLIENHPKKENIKPLPIGGIIDVN